MSKEINNYQILYSRKDEEVKAAINEADKIVKGECYVDEEVAVGISPESTTIFRKYVADCIESLGHRREGSPDSPLVQRFLHPENPLLRLQVKLETASLLDEKEEQSELSVTSGEVNTLGYVMQSYQVDQRADRELYSFDRDKLDDEAAAYINFIGDFENAGGSPDPNYVDFFQEMLGPRVDH